MALAAGLLLILGAPSRAVADAAAVVELEEGLPAATVQGGGAVVQPMAGFGPGWGADAQIFWRPEGPGNALLLPFESPVTGTYDVVLYYTVAPDYGDFSVRLDDGADTRVAGYGPGVALRSTPLGRYAIAHAHQLHFAVEGKDPRSSGFILGLDRIELLPVDDPGIETTSLPPATRVAVPGLKRLPRATRPARDEFVVVEGGRARLGQVDDGPRITMAPARDLPEGLHWVGDFDGVAGDELLTWDPVSGDHFITRFGPGGAAASARVGRSFTFEPDVFRTVGRFVAPDSSCLLGWREGESFGVRQLVDGVCFSATALLPIAGVAVAADVTGDGRDEAVFVTPDGTLDVFVLGGHHPEQGVSWDLLEFTHQRAADRWSPGLEIAVANVDADPAQEILAMVRASAEVWRLDFDAAGRVAERVRLASGWPAGRALGWPLDTDGDGRDELLVRDAATRALWVATVGADSLELEELFEAPAGFAYPGRFLGGSRHVLLTHAAGEGRRGQLGLVIWEEGARTGVFNDSPEDSIGEFATVLVGDFLPD